MSFAESMKRFNQQAARHRAETFGISADSANPAGPNVAHTPTGAAEVRFRAPIVRSGTELDFREAGVTQRVDAVVHVPDSLGLTFAIGDRITDLSDSMVFRVWRITTFPHSAVTRLVLKKPSPSA